jgi:hypothetical protein
MTCSMLHNDDMRARKYRGEREGGEEGERERERERESGNAAGGESHTTILQVDSGCNRRKS